LLPTATRGDTHEIRIIAYRHGIGRNTCDAGLGPRIRADLYDDKRRRTGPAVTVNAILVTEPDPYTPYEYIVDSISGTRGSQSITGVNDLNDEIYYPGTTQPSGYMFGTYVDSFGLQFTAGGTDYQLYRDPPDTSYISITPYTPVPLLASWVLMVGGLGFGFVALRSRRQVGGAARLLA
jgi:hypothetical protein